MSLKDDLLRKGYFPENLPPPFTSTFIADYFLLHSTRSYLTNPHNTVRSAIYNGSKRGQTRRIFSAVHPVTSHDMATFVSTRWAEITSFYKQENVSFSIPEHNEDADRALTINSHVALEEEKIDRLSAYRFIAATDISRFYYSIYTHSIPWAYHGKKTAKEDRSTRSARVFFNRADWIVRNGQDGQTVGIPVGPDISRVFAEIIGTAIDRDFRRRIAGTDCEILRHVDDVWIGTHSHADAERALSRYREAIREFELDINENKTRILAEDFGFVDDWPSEISEKIEFALTASGRKGRERLRSAMEYSFSMAVKRNDDGILKYVLRYIDQHGLSKKHWNVIEPFLKRLTVHFGHTIDYVARILVWRYLASKDLDIDSWSSILLKSLNTNARLGNDSEICWTIYLHHVLKIKISHDNACRVVENCGALSIVALLHAAAAGLVGGNIFAEAFARLDTETDNGPLWPVFLEWKARRWQRHQRVRLSNDVIKELSANRCYIYNPDNRLVVFRDVEEEKFGDVEFAIEARTSMYDDDG